MGRPTNAELASMDRPGREDLRRLYWDDGLSIREIADRSGVASSSAHQWFKKWDIPTRKSNTEKFGTFRIGTHGYPMFGVKEREGGGWTTKWVLVHRLSAVAEHGFGAVAEADEIHHADGCRMNSGRDNLAPMGAQEHRNEHFGGEYKDPEWLYEQRHVKGRTYPDIADECGVTRRTIVEWVGRLDGRSFEEGKTW